MKSATRASHVSAKRLATLRSVVTDAPVSYSVYSAFSFYGERRGRELSGTWIVAAMRHLGHGLAATRQTLYRMEGSRELASRTHGRRKFYRLTAAARAEATAGLDKIFARDGADAPWDGRWTIVHLGALNADRVERERLHALLVAEGFAPIAAGVFIHPRDRTRRLRETIDVLGIANEVAVFRGERHGGPSDPAFIAQHWQLDALGRRYRRFIARYETMSRAAALPDAIAFVVRFALVFDYLEAAWHDPDLIESMMPPPWPAIGARRLAATLYERLLPGALRFGDALGSRR